MLSPSVGRAGFASPYLGCSDLAPSVPGSSGLAPCVLGSVFVVGDFSSMKNRKDPSAASS